MIIKRKVLIQTLSDDLIKVKKELAQTQDELFQTKEELASEKLTHEAFKNAVEGLRERDVELKELLEKSRAEARDLKAELSKLKDRHSRLMRGLISMITVDEMRADEPSEEVLKWFKG